MPAAKNRISKNNRSIGSACTCNSMSLFVASSISVAAMCSQYQFHTWGHATDLAVDCVVVKIAQTESEDEAQARAQEAEDRAKEAEDQRAKAEWEAQQAEKRSEEAQERAQEAQEQNQSSGW